VSVDHALHTFVLSFAALRRLHFTSKPGAPAEGEVVGRTALAALGIAAVVAQDRAGYFLRSRCDLVPEAGSAATFELVRADGTTEAVSVTFETARELLDAAVKKAAAAGLTWSGSDLVLEPQSKLVQLIVASREKALHGEAEPAEGA
jgi:CRISPR-associated protein Csb1